MTPPRSSTLNRPEKAEEEATQGGEMGSGRREEGAGRVLARRPYMRLCTLDQAAELTGLSRGQVLDRLRQREDAIARGKGPRPRDIPAPVGEVGDHADPVWRFHEMEDWGLRIGHWVAGWNGEPVVGLIGIAEMLGIEDQTARKLVVIRDKHVFENGAPDDEDLPAPIPDTGNLVLYRTETIRTWGIQTGRLRPDGVTPNLLRPKRGVRRE